MPSEPIVDLMPSESPQAKINNEEAHLSEHAVRMPSVANDAV